MQRTKRKGVSDINGSDSEQSNSEDEALNEVDSGDSEEGESESEEENSENSDVDDVEEQSEGEEEEEGQEVVEGSRPKGSSQKKRKFDLPTKDEQLQLHNTEALMRTNLLKLQIDEMLNEVQCDKAFEKKKVQTWISNCIDTIKSESKSMEGKKITQSWIKAKKMKGFQLEGHDAESSVLSFSASSSINVVGSSALNTATNPLLNVDITLSMPDKCFDSRDVLNHGYFNKRKMYLATLCDLLSDKLDTKEAISIGFIKGDLRKPILLIKPALKSSIIVRIIPTLSSSVFKLVQLISSKNNVRPLSWMEKVREGNESLNKQASDLKPTPRYNMAILEDIAAQTQHNFLSQTLNLCKVAKDALVLFKIWLIQRSYRFSFDCIDSHSATLLVAYLVQTKKITNQMNAVGAFTFIMKFMSTIDFSSSVLDFTSTTVQSKQDSDEISWPMTLMYPIFDASSKKQSSVQFNVMWRVSSSSLSDLCSEAKHSLRLIQSDRSDVAFQRLFMKKSSFYGRHDVFVHIPISTGVLKNAVLDPESLDESEEHEDISEQRKNEIDVALCDNTCWEYVSSKAVELAEQALGNRAQVIRAIAISTSEQSMKDGVFCPQKVNESYDDSWTVTLGIVLDKDNCQRRVQKGPSADDEEKVSIFRQFWGPTKSQMRRFQDGSIIEAVVWEEELQKPGYIPRGERIVEEILRHTFSRHIPVCVGNSSEKLTFKTSQLENRFLPGSAFYDSDKSKSAEDADSLSRRAITSLDKLRTILISNMKEDLPLTINTVTGLSADVRYTAFCPPTPNPLLTDNFIQAYSGKQISLMQTPIVVLAQVEGGGKWPKDATAIKKVKLALMLRMSEVLIQKFEISSVPNDDSLDVIYGGYVFRIKLASDMEVEQRLIPALNNSPFNTTVYSKSVIERNVVYPQHCNVVKALHAMHPSFGSSVRLLAAWVSGHYFSECISVETLELIVASVYLDPDSEHAPTSPSAGFRKSLYRLATYDWENTPLIVDFSSKMNQVDRSFIASAFTSARQEKTGAAMYIVSSCDKPIGYEPSSKIANRPKRVELRMITSKATACLAILSNWVENVDDSNDDFLMDTVMKSKSSMDRCNVVFQFHDSLYNTKAMKSQIGCEWMENISKGPPMARMTVFSNLSKKEASMDSLIVQEGTTAYPIQESIIANLKKTYGDIALFFWNFQRGSELGIMWKPSAFLSSKFSILETRNKLALTSAEGVSLSLLNSSQIISDMQEVSKGLLKQPKFY